MTLWISLNKSPAAHSVSHLWHLFPSIEYKCKDQRYTATGADKYIKTCLVGEAAALDECKMVDMEAPTIEPHQATVKITFSAARHPTTDPSKYGIALYSYAGLRLQSQYTTIKQVGPSNSALDFPKFHRSDFCWKWFNR